VAEADTAGDAVTVDLASDDAPRTVDVPDDLAAARVIRSGAARGCA
jgi:hypothetical protein